MQPVTHTTDGRTRLITLNRPQKRNALTVELVESLQDAITRAAKDPGISVLVINGAGPDFCAGMDLDQALHPDKGPTFRRRFGQSFLGLLELIERVDLPVIAAAHGAALAGGTALVTACDLAVVDPSSRLGYPGTLHGLVAPPVIPSLIRAAGERRARELLLTGRTVDGIEALRLNLATHLAEHMSVIDTAMNLARALEYTPPGAVAQIKDTIRILRQADASTSSGPSGDILCSIQHFPRATDSL